MELLKRMEAFTAAQGLVKNNHGGKETNLGVGDNEYNGGEEEAVSVLGVENPEQDDSQEIVEDGVVDMDFERFINGVSQEDIAGYKNFPQQEVIERKPQTEQGGEEVSLCQLLVEENSDQPGTYRVTLVDVGQNPEDGRV